MSFLREWILGITCAALLAALLAAFLPKRGGVRQAGHLAAGLLLMLAAVQPLSGLDFESLAATLAELRVSQSGRSEELATQSDEILKQIIESETEAYILDKANGLGIQCQVEVTYAADEDGSPYPVRVRVAGNLSEDQKEQLSQVLESELGLPAPRQEFTQEVG